MMKITKREYEMLKRLEGDWRWIARDFVGSDDDNLFLHPEKPYKDYRTEMWKTDNDRFLPVDGHFFKSIQWENREPYSIAELIREYESEKTEVNILERAKILESDYDKVIEELTRYVDQLDEPEVKQLYEKIRELETFNDELIRDNNQFRNELDNQEALSEEWIERNTSPADNEGRLYVWKRDLQNAIVPKQEGLESKIEALIEDYNREYSAYNSYSENVLIDGFIEDLKNLVEEEEKYYLKIGNLYLAEPLGDMTSDIVRMTRDKEVAYQFTDEKSIATHLDNFEGIEAVKVEELEE